MGLMAKGLAADVCGEPFEDVRFHDRAANPVSGITEPSLDTDELTRSEAVVKDWPGELVPCC